MVPHGVESGTCATNPHSLQSLGSMATAHNKSGVFVPGTNKTISTRFGTTTPKREESQMPTPTPRDSQSTMLWAKPQVQVPSPSSKLNLALPICKGNLLRQTRNPFLYPRLSHNRGSQNMEPTAVNTEKEGRYLGKTFFSIEILYTISRIQPLPPLIPQLLRRSNPQKTRFLGIVRVSEANETTSSCRMNR